MEMNVEISQAMRISREPSPVQFMIDQKRLENVWYFDYFANMITYHARCVCEIKSKITMAKAACSKRKILFTSKLDLNLREELVNCYI
jgi:hypothetical protein